jgi:hypothetical protein
LKNVFSSRWFWRASLLLFGVQAVYIACVGRFSMAFDEFFHLEAIQQYAQVFFPWQITQPTGPAELSAFMADGSYLYHYLMSWPYRLMTFVTDSQTAHVIMIRLIDVAIVVAGLYIFRKVLSTLGVPRAVNHVILAFVMLMPMTAFMAGQLTYDSLFFTLCALTFLWLVRLTKQLAEHNTLRLKELAWAGAFILLTSQVKYAFLPAALGAGLYGAGALIWGLRMHKLDIRKQWREWRRDVRLGSGMLAVGVLLLSFVFFVQRYGMNYVRYGVLVPECSQVLGHERCLGFAPYARDADIRSKGWYEGIDTADKLKYPAAWYAKMVQESYFSVGPHEVGYPVAKPLPVVYTAGKILAAIVPLVVVLRLPWLWRSTASARLLLAIVTTYTLVLFLKNYDAYVSTAVPLSIHGRYVLPFLPLIGYLTYAALKPFVNSKTRRRFALGGTAMLLLMSVWGGGIAAYTIRSSDAWYWPAAQPVSRTVRSALWPLVLR